MCKKKIDALPVDITGSRGNNGLTDIYAYQYITLKIKGLSLHWCLVGMLSSSSLQNSSNPLVKHVPTEYRCNMYQCDGGDHRW